MMQAASSVQPLKRERCFGRAVSWMSRSRALALATMAMMCNARAFSTALLARGGARAGLSSSRARGARVGRRGMATMQAAAARRMPAGAAPYKTEDLVKEENGRGESGAWLHHTDIITLPSTQTDQPSLRC